MTQHEISHDTPLPRCRQGHIARHIHDLRGPSAGGGHFIECRCGRPRKHPDFDAALVEWRRMHRIRSASVKPPADPAGNVVQMALRLPA